MGLTTITNAMVSVNAIQGTLIADNAITAVHIATNAVSGTLVADNAITATHIAQNVITVTQLADDAVEADKIADGVITTNHLNKAMISSQTEVSVATGDFVLLGDTSDSNNLKKAPISSILAGTLTTAAQTNITSVGTLTGLTVNGAAVFNENSADVDFRIESNGNANMLFVDGGNNRVGVGTGTLNREFTVYKADQCDLAITAANNQYAQLCFGDPEDDNIGSIGYNNSDNSMQFVVNASERMHIDSSGNVTVAGNVILSGTSKVRFDHSLIGDDIFDTDSFGIACDHTESIRFGTESSDGSSFTERFRIDNTGNQSQYGAVNLGNNFYLDSGTSQGAFNFSWFTDGASALQSVAHMYVQQGSGDGAARKAEIIFQVADNNAPNTVLSLFNNKNATLVGTLTQSGSDERIKKNITPIANATDKLKTLRGVEFDWNTDVCPFEGHEVGLIAQDVEKVIPSAVKLAPFDTSDKDKTSISGQDYKTIQYDKVIPLLVETIKELEARLKTIEDA